jgi:hypothetical protein
MIRALTIAATLLAALVFGAEIPLVRLFNVLQSLSVAVSIMIAAVLVRLNRGMPSLDWKNISANERAQLTERILEITREYIAIVAIYSAFLIVIIFLTAVGKDDVQKLLPPSVQWLSAAAIGGGAVLCIARMAYVIWRDLDIVKLQKHLGSSSVTLGL